MADAGDLGRDALRRLVQQVAAPGAPEPFGAYLFRSDEAGAELGRHLERVVFLKAFGNTQEQLEHEYGPYETSSFFLCVLDHLRGLPAGVIRVLQPSAAGFKSLNDLERGWGEPAKSIIARTGLSMDPARTWDIATLAVGPDYRAKATAGLITMGLYQSLALAAQDRGIEWWVAILDMPVYRILRWKLLAVFAGYQGLAPRPYLGSTASLPVWCNVREAERRLAALDPHLHALFAHGIGLEPALRRLELPERLALPHPG